MPEDLPSKPKRKAQKRNRSTLTQAQAIVIAAIITTVVGGFFAIQAAVQPIKLGINTTQTVDARLTTFPLFYATETALSEYVTATTSAFSTLISARKQSMVSTVSAELLPQSITPLPDPPSNPQIFVLWYFDTLLQTRDYAYMRTFLTDRYQQYAVSDFQNYEVFWDNVEKMEITESTVIQRETNRATIGIRAYFSLKELNSSVPVDTVYNLTYNQQKQSWQFDYLH